MSLQDFHKAHPEVSLDDAKSEVTAGHPVWEGSQLYSNYVYQPAVERPYINGKPATKADWAGKTGSAFDWKEVSPASYWNIKDVDQPALSVLRQEGCINDGRFNALFLDCGESIAKQPSFTTVSLADTSKSVQIECRLAEVDYWMVQAVRALDKSSTGKKKNFVQHWGSKVYFSDLEVDLSIGFITLCRKVIGICKRPGDDLNLRLNHTFHSFKIGCLATWKVGESRDNFLKRSLNAVNYWHGVHATWIVESFKRTPEGKMDVKPALSGARALVRKAQRQSSKVVSSGLSYAESLKEKGEAKRKALLSKLPATPELPLQEELSLVDSKMSKANILARHLYRRGKDAVTAPFKKSPEVKSIKDVTWFEKARMKFKWWIRGYTDWTDAQMVAHARNWRNGKDSKAWERPILYNSDDFMVMICKPLNKIRSFFSRIWTASTPNEDEEEG